MLNSADKEYSKFATKKWYLIDSESKGVFSKNNLIRFLMKSIGSSLCNYYDAYVLFIGNIAIRKTIAAAGNDLVKNNETLAAAI